MSSNKKDISKNEKKSSGNSALKIIGTVIVGLAIVGLVFSSVSSGGNGRRDSLVFGKYGNKDIRFLSDNEFGQAVEDEMKRYNISSADANSPYVDLARRMAWSGAFNSVVVNKAIAFHVEDSGYTVSSRAVDRMIVDYGPWRTNGVFDEELYANASASSKESVRSQFKQQAEIEKWASDTLERKFRSYSQMSFLDDMRRNVKSYQMVSIPFSDFPEDQVMAYASENTEIFASLPVSRISVESEVVATEISGLIEDSSSSFTDLAIEYSQDAYSTDGGDMGFITRYGLGDLIGDENAELVFDAGDGEVIGPLDTNYGWIFFHIDGPKVPADVNENVEEVRSFMLQNEVGIVEDNLLAKAERLRAEALTGESFKDVVSGAGYEVMTTGAFPVNFGGDSILGSNPENAGLAEMSGSTLSESFWKEIIPLQKVGQVSAPVVLNNSIALFSLDSESELEVLDYWDLLVNSDASRQSQQDFRSAVLSDENEYFKSSFMETYDNLFQVEL